MITHVKYEFKHVFFFGGVICLSRHNSARAAPIIYKIILYPHYTVIHLPPTR